MAILNTGQRKAGAASDTSSLDLGVLDDLVGYHLRRSSALFGADFNRVIGELGMRQVPFAVLTMVARHPGVNQGAIGRALGIQRANMVALVSDLLNDGLVERSEVAEDRRAFALTLTAAGKALLQKCMAHIEQHEADLLADFSAQERQVLIALLARIESKER